MRGFDPACEVAAVAASEVTLEGREAVLF
jgi:hypothetical protein